MLSVQIRANRKLFGVKVFYPPNSIGKTDCPYFQEKSKSILQKNITEENTHGKDKGVKMFELNDVLVYGTNGVCKISDIRKENLSGIKAETYYILSPIFGTQSTLYIPTENRKLSDKLRPVMVKEKLSEIMNTAKENDLPWETDDRVRGEKFHDIVANGLSSDLLLVIKCIVRRRNELKLKIKKLHAADERTLALCEKIASEEYAYAYGIDIAEAVTYIENELTAA